MPAFIINPLIFEFFCLCITKNVSVNGDYFWRNGVVTYKFFILLVISLPEYKMRLCGGSL